MIIDSLLFQRALLYADRRVTFHDITYQQISLYNRTLRRLGIVSQASSLNGALIELPSHSVMGGYVSLLNNLALYVDGY